MRLVDGPLLLPAAFLQIFAVPSTLRSGQLTHVISRTSFNSLSYCKTRQNDETFLSHLEAFTLTPRQLINVTSTMENK
jgi:hypothetical protein